MGSDGSSTGTARTTRPDVARIYLSAPHMGDLEATYVKEAFDTNWLSSVGPNLDAFEAALEELVGAPTCALTSGTAAMHLGLRAMGVGPGDIVLCPSLTFVASVNPALYLGARPVFLDSERRSWNLDPNVLEDALRALAERGQRPAALVVVHLYGQSADLDAILPLAERFGVPVLEDAAEALGTLHRGRQVGALADVGALSFNGNKIITTTGGGAITSRDRSVIDRARFWSTQARDPGVAYEHSELGYNYRMSNVLAGIGRGQLSVLSERVKQRRRIAFAYRDAFADLDGLELMPQADWGLHTNWLSVFSVDEARLGVSRDALIAALAREDIEARPAWKPMHLQPLFADAERFGGSVAEEVFANGICLPSSSFLTDADLDRVTGTVRAAVEGGARA
ncbi:MAG: DegT/DnrJ/EryC1/StrS family aminotransferase [Sandaracinaceae bacterium]|nr:DegT/DnrJ/EryC1/StrS family aminotransferase [Sandaracinaceae bacterium]